MTDYPKALAAARECLDNEGHRATDALRDLLAALDAARGEAVLEIVGGEDGWRGTWEHLPLSEFDVGTKLYAAPPAAAVAAENVTPMRQPRADLARLVESINAAVYVNGDGLSVTEAIGALEIAKLELFKEQEK